MEFDLALFTIVLQLIFLEGILSIDNAAVLGAMVSILPDDQPVPYPKQLKFLQAPTNRILGMQQTAALKVGLLGAYLGRALMLFIASFIIQNLWLRLIGALYLVKLAFSHLPQYADEGDHHEAQEAIKVTAGTFWRIVLAVELADLAFSLDNVVVAVTLSDELWIVMLGVALGIVTMRFAAGIFTKMIGREPILAPAAYVLVLFIGLRLLIEDLHLIRFPESIESNMEWIQFGSSVAILGLAVVYARVPIVKRIFQPPFHLVGHFMAIVNRIFDVVLHPLGLLVHKLFGWLVRLIRWMMKPITDSKKDKGGPAGATETGSTEDVK